MLHLLASQFSLILSLLLLSHIHIINYLVPRLASAVTWPVVRARGAGSPTGVQKHSKFPFKGLHDPEEMAME